MSEQADNQPLATVLITTCNRKELLCDAIDSALAQTATVELIVVDDGSTDGTSEEVRRRYPSVRLVRHEESMGIIAARNHAANLASTNLIFTLDDDAVYSSPDVVAATIAQFDHPRIGAIAIPLIEYQDEEAKTLYETAPERDDDFDCTFDYIGCSNAVRLDLFKELEGYQGQGRQNEETTYCARLLNAGYVVRLGQVGYVYHFPSSLGRDLRKIQYYRQRNNTLFIWQQVPMPWLLIHLAGASLNGLRQGIAGGALGPTLRGLGEGFLQGLKHCGKRQPMATRTYRLMRRLIKRRSLPFTEVEPSLPPKKFS